MQTKGSWDVEIKFGMNQRKGKKEEIEGKRRKIYEVAGDRHCGAVYLNSICVNWLEYDLQLNPYLTQASGSHVGIMPYKRVHTTCAVSQGCLKET